MARGKIELQAQLAKRLRSEWAVLEGVWCEHSFMFKVDGARILISDHSLKLCKKAPKVAMEVKSCKTKK